MQTGRTAKDALHPLTAADEGRDVRQVVMVDVQGNESGERGDRLLDGGRTSEQRPDGGIADEIRAGVPEEREVGGK